MKALVQQALVEQIQRIPYNRLLTAFLKALFQQALVEQVQRVPFNRLLTAFLRALFQQVSVEQIQRRPFNQPLTAIFWGPLLAVSCGRLFSGFWRAARNRQFPFTASLTTDSFLAPCLGGYFWRVVFSVFVDYPNSTISHHSFVYKIQRIPFNRLLTAFLKALFQQVFVEQI